MMRMGRILLVEPEEDRRHDLSCRLADSGHDVAAVGDEAAAVRLLEEGLDPDVVLSAALGPDGERSLRGLAPRAVHLRLGPPGGGERSSPCGAGDGDGDGCPGEPGEVLRRVEEVLLEHVVPDDGVDDRWRVLDLSRRLASSLPRATSPEERIELLTDGFHAFFGVRGFLVLRRGAEKGQWIEVRQGLDEETARDIAAEMARRSRLRDIRPFLARVRSGDRVLDVAGLAVERGERHVDLALDLERAPEEPCLREALMNLLGAALRAAARTERLERAEDVAEAQTSSFDGLLEMAEEFTRRTHRGALCERILAALRRELRMARSAIFLPRGGGDGLLELRAVSGFSGARLERIGLSCFHGTGQEILEGGRARRLGELSPRRGAAVRESRMLSQAGLEWAAPLAIGEQRLGVLFFGGKDGEPGLGTWERQILRALVASAAVALRNLEQIEEFQELSLGCLRSLGAAAEVRRPRDRGHGERVARYAVLLGRALGLDARELRHLAFSALVHDVGKIGIDPRDDGNPAKARLHPALATRILSPAHPPPEVVQGVEQHHERWDGCGYPYGLSGTSIHLFGRIVAIANAYDRLTRGAQHPVAPEQALLALERGAGLRWDPGLLAVFSGEASRAGPRQDPSGELRLEEIVGAG